MNADLQYIKVKDAYEGFIVECVTIKRSAYIHEAIEALIEKPTAQTIYIVDDDGRLLGILPIRDLLRLASARYGIRPSGVGSFFKYLYDVMKSDVEEVMRPPLKVKLEDSLRDALKLMEAYGLSDLPVVDSKDKVIGELNGIEVLKYMVEGVAKGEKKYQEIQEQKVQKDLDRNRSKSKK